MKYKKFQIIFFLLCIILPTYALSGTSLIKIFSPYNDNYVLETRKYDFIKTFIGDTITFRIGSIDKITCIRKLDPDTIWMKKKPKKNPILGKHYKLNYIYKGIEDQLGNFYTPKSEFENGQFVVLDVCTSNVSQYIYKDNLSIKLLDLNTLDSVTLLLGEDSNMEFSIKSKKLANTINQIINKCYYIKDSRLNDSRKSEFIQYNLASVDYNITFGKFYRYIDSKIEFKFKSKDDTISFIPSDRIYESQRYTVLPEAEYKEEYTPITINSNLNDSILTHEIKLPFKFCTILGVVDSYSSDVSQKIIPNRIISSYDSGMCNKKCISSGTIVGILDKFTIKKKDFYTASLNGKAFFINAKDVRLPDGMSSRIDSLMLCDKEQKDFYFNTQLNLSKMIYFDKIDNVRKEFNSFAKYGLAIKNWGVYDISEYTDGTGIQFTFFNPTKKTIKYITINFRGYNSVNDPVGYTLTRKGIGPIEPGEIGSYDFEYVWFTDIVEYAKIKSILVQYTNGTFKTITNIKPILYSDDLTDFLSKDNPVEDFE